VTNNKHSLLWCSTEPPEEPIRCRLESADNGLCLLGLQEDSCNKINPAVQNLFSQQVTKNDDASSESDTGFLNNMSSNVNQPRPPFARGPPPNRLPIVGNPLDALNHQRQMLPINLWGSTAVEEATDNFFLQCEQQGSSDELSHNKGVH
jgi:hypothetical protein